MEPQALFDHLVAKGVDITDEISPKPHGVDFAIRDPFGNRLRIGAGPRPARLTAASSDRPGRGPLRPRPR